MSKTLVRYNDPQEYRPQLLQRVYKKKLYSKELHCASQLKFYRYVGVFHRAHRWPLQVYIFIGSRKRGDGRWGPAAGRGGAQRYWGIGKPSIRISLAMPSVCIEFRIRNWVLHASLSLNTHTTEAQSPRPVSPLGFPRKRQEGFFCSANASITAVVRFVLLPKYHCEKACCGSKTKPVMELIMPETLITFWRARTPLAVSPPPPIQLGLTKFNALVWLGSVIHNNHKLWGTGTALSSMHENLGRVSLVSIAALDLGPLHVRCGHDHILRGAALLVVRELVLQRAAIVVTISSIGPSRAYGKYFLVLRSSCTVGN